MTGGHRCPFCAAETVPAFRCACHRCWRSMPRPMARQLLGRWQRRVLYPGEYAEALAAVWMWRRDQKARAFSEAKT